MGLWRSLLLPCLLGHIAASKGAQPQCLTDYATEVVCRWEVDAAINCTREFRLRYGKETVPGMSTCIPESGGSASECICVIPEKHFRRVRFRVLLLRADGKRTWNGTVSLEDKVKPRRLVNLTVGKGEKKRSFLLTWKWDYIPSEEFEELFNFDPAYQVSYWPEGQMEKELVSPPQCPDRGKLCHEIFASQLLPGGSYVARVRVKNDMLGGHWSEWSESYKWRNDLPPEPGNDVWPVALVCAVIMALVFTGYVCFTRLKKDWWDRIPSPAKSKMAEDMKAKPVLAVRKMHPIHDGRAPLHAACERSRGKAWGRRSVALPGLTPRETASEEPEVFLTPEVPFVEHSLTVCSGVPHVGPGSLAREVAGPAPHEDAMTRLFLKMLQGRFEVQEQPVSRSRPLEQPPALRPLCSRPETPLGRQSLSTTGDSMETSSESGYRSSSTRAASPWKVGLAPEHYPGHSLFPAEAQPSLLLGPPESPDATDELGPPPGCQGSAGLVANGYKCFSSLLPQPAAGGSQAWEQQLFTSSVEQSQPHLCDARPRVVVGPMGPEPGGRGLLGPVSCKDSASPGPAAPPLSGYHSFSSALENSTAAPPKQACQGLTSYKSFLSILQGSPAELPGTIPLLDRSLEPQEAACQAWPGLPWEEGPGSSLGLRVEDGPDKGLFRGEAAEDRGLLCP